MKTNRGATVCSLLWFRHMYNIYTPPWFRAALASDHLLTGGGQVRDWESPTWWRLWQLINCITDHKQFPRGINEVSVNYQFSFCSHMCQWFSNNKFCITEDTNVLNPEWDKHYKLPHGADGWWLQTYCEGKKLIILTERKQTSRWRPDQTSPERKLTCWLLYFSVEYEGNLSRYFWR